MLHWPESVQQLVFFLSPPYVSCFKDLASRPVPHLPLCLLIVAIDHVIATTDCVIKTTDHVIATTDHVIVTTDHVIATTDRVIATTYHVITITNHAHHPHSRHPARPVPGETNGRSQ